MHQVENQGFLRAFKYGVDGGGPPSAPIGTATKFAVPGTDGNRAYVGTRDGKVFGFGRPTTAALTSTPTDFGNVAVGTTANATVTVTATRPVAISAIATAASFGATPPALPVTLNTGGTATVNAAMCTVRSGARTRPGTG